MQSGHDYWTTQEESVCERIPAGHARPPIDAANCPARLDIGLLTGGQDRHYAVGLGMALMERNVAREVIGSDEIEGPEFRGNPRAKFRNLHGSQQTGSLTRRLSRVVLFYARLFRYVAAARPKIFHILWNNKLEIFDRTLLMTIYKVAGKKVVLTAHNVNAARRDKKDSWLNRRTLKCQYSLADHIFVHTNKMKQELAEVFDVKAEKVTVIPYGINNVVPFTEQTSAEARRMLGLQEGERVILYFGAIKQYKGLEYLVTAFQQIAAQGNYRLIIAGERKKGHEEYWRSIQQTIEAHASRERILLEIKFIPDDETEIYFKAADVAVLPYIEIFQSGILFMAYSFGLPVIATDVGSLAEEIIEGRSGFICKPCNAEDLAGTIQRYFKSDLYKELACRRHEIRDYALSRHSWDVVGDITRKVYVDLLRTQPPQRSIAN